MRVHPHSNSLPSRDAGRPRNLASCSRSSPGDTVNTGLADIHFRQLIQAYHQACLMFAAERSEQQKGGGL
jgi:hypothetical protein